MNDQNDIPLAKVVGTKEGNVDSWKYRRYAINAALLVMAVIAVLMGIYSDPESDKVVKVASTLYYGALSLILAYISGATASDLLKNKSTLGEGDIPLPKWEIRRRIVFSSFVFNVTMCIWMVFFIGEGTLYTTMAVDSAIMLVAVTIMYVFGRITESSILDRIKKIKI